jgi:hypothetical protein
MTKNIWFDTILKLYKSFDVYYIIWLLPIDCLCMAYTNFHYKLGTNSFINEWDHYSHDSSLALEIKPTSSLVPNNLV